TQKGGRSPPLFLSRTQVMFKLSFYSYILGKVFAAKTYEAKSSLNLYECAVILWPQALPFSME
ncbi:hypothetical protein, partial [Nitrosomonas sp.]|uniref:hypothetical protein n=1 Tax=Nitrosomonas sp. TaxID=42353 RepID=UPI0037C99968